MIRLIVGAAVVVMLAGVLAWTYILGCQSRARARRQIAQATIRDLAPGHPAGRGIHPEDPRLSEPLTEQERTVFDAITGESQSRRRVLVARTPKNVPDCAAGEVAPSGAQRPAAGAAEALQHAGRKEGAGAPRRFGGVAEAGSCAPTPQVSEGGRR